MQITIIAVSTPQTIKTYQVIEVTYKDEQGRTSTKKLMSFANPKVFKAIQDFGNGDVVEVTTIKEGEYWQWTNIVKAGTDKREADSPKQTGGKVLGSNYETPEERAKKQVYIVRQSSISSAIATLSIGAKSAPSAETVIDLASKYEAFVFGTNEAKGSFDDFEDDIPL